MKKDKIRVGILFGGQSAEHEVSLQSARNVFEAIDKTKYEPILIGIDKTGTWLLQEKSHFLLHADDPKLIALNKSPTSVVLAPWRSNQNLQFVGSKSIQLGVDVVFPVLHGPYGEDGTVQGLLKLAHVPFVGAGVTGSALGMDKDVMKRLLREADLPVTDFLVFHDTQREKLSFVDIKKKLGFPFFVKPANLGSSVGVSKVKTESDFIKALKAAFSFDTKILVERLVAGREIECAVLGNDDPKASIAGEVIPNHEFYSYNAKYIDENGADLEIPAKLSDKKMREVQRLAVRAFQMLCCEGMARVDFFLEKSTGKLFINEINTIPGFTKISMYPKLWNASGIGYTELIDRLIQLAIERFKKEQKLKTSIF